MLKVRVKYSKMGVLRFISHLDVMRLFQKAIRRADLDIAYSGGFSPHQIISFAAPMPLGMTSVGEYFDADFNSVTSTVDMVNRLNEVLPEYAQVSDIVILPEKAKNSMSVVSASDYIVYKNDEAEDNKVDVIQNYIDTLNSSEEVKVVKKTKTKEELTDIKPMIYELKTCERGIYMRLKAGSNGNLKPESVVEALCNFAGIEYDRYDYMVERQETYLGDAPDFKPLAEAGKRF